MFMFNALDVRRLGSNHWFIRALMKRCCRRLCWDIV